MIDLTIDSHINQPPHFEGKLPSKIEFEAGATKVQTITYPDAYDPEGNKFSLKLVNFDEKYMDKTKELIIEGCSKNPNSDLITLFREGLREDFNNPNWVGVKKEYRFEKFISKNDIKYVENKCTKMEYQKYFLKIRQAFPVLSC